jgi:hypothetical protein
MPLLMTPAADFHRSTQDGSGWNTVWGSETRIPSCGDRVVLVNKAAENVSPTHVFGASCRWVQERRVRGSQIEPAMGAVGIVVLQIGVQEAIEMPTTQDEREGCTYCDPVADLVSSRRLISNGGGPSSPRPPPSV